MRRAIALITLALAACGPSREVARRPPVNSAGSPPQFVQLVGIRDASCGPDVVPPASPGRFPGPCATWAPNANGDIVAGVTYGYDDAGRMTSWWNGPMAEQWSYDVAGRLGFHATCGGDHCASEYWAYDDAGRMAGWGSADEGAGASAVNQFDTSGQLVATSIDYSDVDTTHVHGSYTLDAAGKPLHIDLYDQDGGWRGQGDWTYDALERPTSHRGFGPPVYREGTTNDGNETWAYDDAGRLSLHTISDPYLGLETHRFVDGLEVETSFVAATGGNASVTTYCANGLPHTVANYSLAPDGGVTGFTGGFEYWYGPQGVWTRMTELDGGGTIATQRLDPAGNVLVRDGIPAPHTLYGMTHATYDYSCFGSR